MTPPDSSPLPAAAPVTPVRRLLGVLRWFRLLFILVIVLFLSAAAGLVVAPNFMVFRSVCLGLFVVLVIALIRWRVWFLSPQARKLHAALAGLVVGLVCFLAWDESTVRLQLTQAGLTPLPPHGVESAALYNRMATPINGKAPFVESKIVRREATTDPIRWRKFIEANRDAIRTDWDAATDLRAWIAGLDAFDLIGDTTTSWDSLSSIFPATRTASFLYCHYASLLALEGRGDEALAVATQLLSVSNKLRPTARSLVRFMVAIVLQGMGQDTARFILANASPSPGAVRALAAVLERGTSPGSDLHRVLMSEYAGTLPAVLLQDDRNKQAPFGRLPWPLVAVVYNPRATANRLATAYEQLATAAAGRDLAELRTLAAPGFFDFGRPAFKNPAGRLMIQMAIPAFTKVTESTWKKDDDRRALLVEVKQRLAAAGADNFRPAAARPDFTGTWKIDTQASRTTTGAPMTNYEFFTLTFGHREPELSIVQDIRESGSSRTLVYSVNTDGQERRTTLYGLPAVAWARWEGNALKLYLKRDLEPEPARKVESIRTITLAPDGKTMTATIVVRQYPSAEISMRGNEVWRKQ